MFTLWLVYVESVSHINYSQICGLFIPIGKNNAGPENTRDNLFFQGGGKNCLVHSREVSYNIRSHTVTKSFKDFLQPYTIRNIWFWLGFHVKIYQDSVPDIFWFCWFLWTFKVTNKTAVKNSPLNSLLLFSCISTTFPSNGI